MPVLRAPESGRRSANLAIQRRKGRKVPRDYLLSWALPSLAGNTIADGAKHAATLALAQGHQLGIDDPEAAAKPDGARADRLAYE